MPARVAKRSRVRRRRRLPHIRVFLSHAIQDREFAEQLRKSLRKAGIYTWFSPRQLVGAEHWLHEIGKGLRRCNWFLVILTPHAVRSRWVRHEVLYALQENRFEKRIVPVLRRDCITEKLAWPLVNIQYIDFRTDLTAGYRGLSQLWRLKVSA